MKVWIALLALLLFSLGTTQSTERSSSPTLYIEIDARFSPLQRIIIENDIDRWQTLLGDRVHLINIFNKQMPGRFKDHQKPINRIFMWKINKTKEELGEEKLRDSFGILAEVDADSEGCGSNIIVFDSLSSADYRKVILHEIGHLLGEHHSTHYGDLMYPYVWGQRDVVDHRLLASVCARYGGIVEGGVCR